MSELKNIMLREISQSQKTIYYMILFIRNVQNTQNSKMQEVNSWLAGATENEYDCLLDRMFVSGMMVA